MQNSKFLSLLQQMGEELYREMPWRRDTRPYYVLVSELMLQQTQVDRVIPRFEKFIIEFPDEHILAAAPLSSVLRLWQGLGYNRRAKYLHDSAKMLVESGHFPIDAKELSQLPGVGKNTAGAIMAYAYDEPTIFIETNVRAVYIHHFFSDKELVDDKEIYSKMLTTVPWSTKDESMKKSFGPRRFYWALMDYGSWLKKQGVTPARSSNYKKQPSLKGSVREVRGQIISLLADGDRSRDTLVKTLSIDDRFPVALSGLMRDGLVQETDGYLHLTK